MPDFSKFEEQVFLTTVLIRNLTDGHFGTGFIVQKPHSEGKVKYLLFSNKHVFWSKDSQDDHDVVNEFELTLHKKDENADFILGNTHTFRFHLTRSHGAYFDHPDPDVDVACCNISEIFNSNENLQIKTITSQNFLAPGRTETDSGKQIFFVGYPTGFYDLKHNLPIMRSGIIASIPSVDFNGAPQILVDAQVFPGSSGSPVFVVVQNHYRLLGVISDAIIKDLHFKDALSGQNQIPIEYMGLGLVFTIDTIKEVFDLAD